MRSRRWTEDDSPPPASIPKEQVSDLDSGADTRSYSHAQSRFDTRAVFREELLRRSPVCAVIYSSSYCADWFWRLSAFPNSEQATDCNPSLRDLLASEFESAPEVPLSVVLLTKRSKVFIFAENSISTLANLALLRANAEIEACASGMQQHFLERGRHEL
jgi:hypothetical protein